MIEKRSKRTYPKQKCPFCKEFFVPTDSRQIYCCPQHQINFNNDRYKKKEAPIRENNKLLKQNAAILKKLKERQQKLRWPSVPKHLLEYEGYKRDVFDKENYNKVSKQPIYWSFGYGLESLDAKGTSFIIHEPQK